MTSFPYRLTGPIGAKATLGLIVLQVDETVEQDFRRAFAVPDVALHMSRIPSGAELTPGTIAAMEAELPRAAALLPPSAQFDAVGYACTSGTTLIGAQKVTSLVTGSANTRAVSNPLTASVAALQVVKARSIAIVSPYIASVADAISMTFGAHGFDVRDTISFGEDIEARVARIDPQSIHAAAMQAGRADGVEAVFLSCTNLRTFDIIDDLENRLGLPVISSNQALVWHMARSCGAPVTAEAPGGLFRL
ncbi:Maleate isomerase [Thalassovita gelatinovora]|uniref:Maleate isomerase n=1 Tax=Thalassovita gelatinovora TaxID=53501 RepID=A0A0P1FCA9_THAGE|nr:aspartate/glutamate racemase family protein [Thalassovita gelatinovora]QIZ80440.1 Asp/Glu racemase [Thalassovita gelatinovora]CUH65836.1 Maleate isomerase [Thalassovita gelatinovora]SEQ72534.1 maleate isomerase [Thalassovita gelatinovora]